VVPLLIFRNIPLALALCGPLWAQAAVHYVAVTHVTVVNPSESSPHAATTVLIENDAIIKVGPSKSVEIPRGATVVNATGKFLIPALWDMHVHTENAQRDFPMFVANGVLGVRNMAGVPKDVFRWREETASGKVLGPQIVAAGPLIDGPEPAHPEHAISVHNPAEGKQAVRSLKAMGADFVKIYDGVPRDAYFAIAEESKKVGLPFAGHVPGSIRVTEASNAGQHSLEHGAYLSGGSTYEDDAINQEISGPDVMEEAKRTGNFSLIPEDIAKRGNALLDHLSSERLTQLYEKFAKNGTYLTPTLVVERGRVFVDQISKQPDPRTRYITKEELESWKPENNMFSKYRTPGYIAYQKREYAETLKGIKLAQQLGVQLLAGTDVVAPYTYPGFSLHEELQLLVEAGLTPREALRTATVNPAQFLGMKDSGVVAAGMKADLVLLDANPLLDIANTKKISAVILHGKLYRRDQLDDLLNRSAKIASRPAR
jgi:imidazolonepropionase-like amidohydrolase